MIFLQHLFILFAHSDDFVMLGRDCQTEWDLLLEALKKNGYEIENRDGHKFVGVQVNQTSDGGYTMNQKEAIEKVLEEVHMMGAEEERMPYPSVQQQPESLSKQDNLQNVQHCISPAEIKECKDFPYRSCVGGLLYIMIHTGIQIMFILNVLSRYCNDPGPRHIFFMKHLLAYMKGIRFDEIIFPSHAGPYDIETMTALLQVSFYVDSDLGGNKDSGRSQTCYIGFLADCMICWCSTTQGSLSTATTESEIKAINHTLKAETISNIGLLNAMGFLQKPVIIYEDNMAAVFAARQPNLTKGLRHLDLNEMFFKEKQAEEVIKVVKIATDKNHADLGTKRLAWIIFAKFISMLVSCKNKFFKVYAQKSDK